MSREVETGSAPGTLAARILVVDDDRRLRAVLCEGLAAHGATVESAASGPEAVARLRAAQFDLLVTDLIMPGMDGVALLRTGFAVDPNLVGVMMSGQGNLEKAVAAVRAGAFDYVAKPFKLADLLRILERGLEVRRLRIENRDLRNSLAVYETLNRQADSLRIQGDLLDQVYDAVFILDMKGVITYWNRAAAALYGWAATEALGRVVGELLQTELPRPLSDIAAEVIRAGHWEGELRHTARNGRLVVTASRWAPARDREGAVTGILQTDIDITERKQAEMRVIELYEAQKALVADLQQANSLKSEFIATMSHELRTPLNAIIGYTDLLLDDTFGPLADEQAGALRRVLRSSSELLRLVESVLDLSRLQKGDLPVDEVDVPLAEVLVQLEEETRAAWEKPEVELIWKLPRSLPMLRTDHGKLLIVLKNLLDNAAKFTDRGSVTFSTEATGDEVVFEVSDTGIGIAQEAQAVIFEPFRQLEPHMTRVHGGTGLGLYVVRRMLEILGGTIALDSELGHGATFRVRLPLKRPAAAA